MKFVSSIFLYLLTLTTAFAQDKTNYVHYNKLIDLKGTDYVVATVSYYGKGFSSNGKYLLFINTKTGEHQQADFPKDSYTDQIEQVKIDKLNLNVVVVSANTVDLDGKHGVDWNDPKQVILFSTDGKQRTQITDDKFFVQTWTVNNETGRVVITGHYDTNDNGKYDKTDKNEIVIYDLLTMKVISKF
ncbi:MAG: hypothetical protein JSR71_13840 [Proteobacteria bacterium]|nr:hypothetical protein [Pseudomonadota bacterium]